MNIDYNTTIQGHYTLYDEEMNILSESDNMITDWGMNRLTGLRDLAQPWNDPQSTPETGTDVSVLAFINNTKYFILGNGTTPVSSTDSWLANSYDMNQFVQTNRQFTKGILHPNITTGTVLSTAPDGDLLVTFNRVSNIQRKGDSNNFNPPDKITEIGCNWISNVHWTQPTNNNRFGVFSRALLSRPVYIGGTQYPNKGGGIIAKYSLTIKTNCNKVLENHISVTNYDVNNPVTLPNHKTNMRALPFYMLSANGEPTGILNNGLAQNQLTRSADGNFMMANRNFAEEYIQPVFEDIGLWNKEYVGNGYWSNTPSVGYNFSGWYNDGVGCGYYDRCPKCSWVDRGAVQTFQDDSLGTSYSSYRRSVDNYWSHVFMHSARKLWWLQGYSVNSSYDGSARYSTMMSTTTSNFNNGVSIKKKWDTKTGKSNTYREVETENLTEHNRKFYDSYTVEKIDNNTWQSKIKFSFRPGEFSSFINGFVLYPATLGDWDEDGVSYVRIVDSTGGIAGECRSSTINSAYYKLDPYITSNRDGIITAFETTGSIPSNVGVDVVYSFTFSRA